MTKPKAAAFAELKKIEQRIDADDHGGIRHRWEYGREVLKSKEGRKQLPDGLIAKLIEASGTKVDRNGNEKPKISEREIRNRVRLAETYTTDQQVGRIIADLGTWTAIIEAGFPPVEMPDEDLLDLIEAMELEPPDGWEQLTLLPGFKPIVKINKREVRFDLMTVPEAIAYRDKYRSMHDSFAKSLDLVPRPRPPPVGPGAANTGRPRFPGDRRRDGSGRSPREGSPAGGRTRQLQSFRSQGREGLAGHG